MTIRPKKESARLLFAGWLMGLLGMRVRWDRTWVTLDGAVYYPSETVQNPLAPIYESIRAHEAIHADRQSTWPRGLRWVWVVCYLVAPVPIFFAWFRYNEERRAFLVNVLRGDITVEQAVNVLNSYLWPWPRRWMRAWFDEQATRKGA